MKSTQRRRNGWWTPALSLVPSVRRSPAARPTRRTEPLAGLGSGAVRPAAAAMTLDSLCPLRPL